MKTSAYLDELRRRLELPSDYALAKRLGVSKTAVSHYRSNRHTFEDRMALKVARLLDQEPLAVLADMAAQRAKEPDEIEAWNSLREKFSLTFSRLGSQATPGYSS